MTSFNDFMHGDIDRNLTAIYGVNAVTSTKRRFHPDLAILATQNLTYPAFDSPPAALGLISTSADDDDDPAGDGCHKVDFMYWATNGESNFDDLVITKKLITDIPLDGSGFVQIDHLVDDFYRQVAMWSSEVGADGWNDGDILLVDQETATLWYGGMEQKTNSRGSWGYVVTGTKARVQVNPFSPNANFDAYDNVADSEIFGVYASDEGHIHRRIGFGRGTSTDYLVSHLPRVLKQYTEVYPMSKGGAAGDAFFLAFVEEPDGYEMTIDDVIPYSEPPPP